MVDRTKTAYTARMLCSQCRLLSVIHGEYRYPYGMTHIVWIP